MTSITYILCLCYITTVFANPNLISVPNERIINGSEAIQGQYKWQVAIFYSTGNNHDFCGGALISNQWVLTNARPIFISATMEIILGASLLNQTQEGQLSLGIEKTVLHPEYEPLTYNNNVALIKLNVSVQFNDFIQPIKLPKASDFLQANIPVWVSGWGKTTNDGSISNVLHYVQLTTITDEKCAESHKILDNVVCCDGTSLQSICQGDVGGALVQYKDSDWVHVGVASFFDNKGCGNGTPSGYIRTSTILDFIYMHTGPI
ncbi:chymotrypsin-like elastase family member 2A [Atheta coriaria]|uniref:chymotrypsin-like elastase family member 2A n=1 Tax=Dalotia coriaria TaxID=877792 RepID=UPI0031F4562F